MANTIGWGQGSANNTNQWGRGATNNSISWGSIYNLSPSGETNIIGGLQPTFELKYDLITTDFTFTRASFGTRVNEFGLIETVTDLGSDLIQNGSFDELGSELVTNGDFEDGDNDWTKLNATISDGKGNLDGTGVTSLLYQGVLTDTKTYQATFTVSNYNGLGSARAINNNGGLLYQIISDGTFTFTFTHSIANSNFIFSATTGAIFSIDNVSIKQVDPNDDWDIEALWTIQDGVASGNGATGSSQELNQNISSSGILIGSTVRCSFEIKNYVSGSVQVIGISNTVSRSSNGIYEFQGDITSFNIRFRGAAFYGDITNVSIQEVLEDDVPRIDYTGSTFDVPVLGNELVTNGDFATDSNWSKQSGWSIANGVATFDINDYVSGSTNIYQAMLTVGVEYVLTYDVVDYVQGFVRNVSASPTIARTANGTYTEKFIATNANLFINCSSPQNTILSVDNISVKEVTAYTTTDKGAFLLEPISTNLLTYSEDFTQWSGISATLINSSSETNPSNINNVGLITGNSGTTSKFATLPISTTSSKHTYSVFLKYNGHQFIQFASGGSTEYGNFDIQNGIVGSGSAGTTLTIESFNNDWYRCVLNTSASITPTNIAIALVDSATSSRLSSTSSVDSVYAWGVQLEALSYATSYIPTTSGTTVTRAQETCLDATPTINSEEGVLYAEISALSEDGTNRYITLSNFTPTNRLITKYGTSDLIQLISINPNGGASMTDSSGADILINHKIAFRYETNNYAMFIDGVKVDEDLTSGTFDEGILTKLSFSNSTQTGQNFYGRTKDLRIYDKALTDDELINLTTI